MTYIATWLANNRPAYAEHPTQALAELDVNNKRAAGYLAEWFEVEG